MTARVPCTVAYFVDACDKAIAENRKAHQVLTLYYHNAGHCEAWFATAKSSGGVEEVTMEPRSGQELTCMWKQLRRKQKELGCKQREARQPCDTKPRKSPTTSYAPQTDIKQLGAAWVPIFDAFVRHACTALHIDPANQVPITY